jgi:hypothetical protein
LGTGRWTNRKIAHWLIVKSRRNFVIMLIKSGPVWEIGFSLSLSLSLSLPVSLSLSLSLLIFLEGQITIWFWFGDV